MYASAAALVIACARRLCACGYCSACSDTALGRRSRNDQVATDYRLWLLNELKATRDALQTLIAVACDRAEAESKVLMPGFTHLQPAQTVRWGHWLMCHCSTWMRDDQRLRDLTPRLSMLPLGSGALAGNPFLVDRQFLAKVQSHPSRSHAASLSLHHFVSAQDTLLHRMCWCTCELVWPSFDNV